jgi:hypothetical protein
MENKNVNIGSWIIFGHFSISEIVKSNNGVEINGRVK